MQAFLEPLKELADYPADMFTTVFIGENRFPANRRMCEFTEDTSCESTERWL